jgi:cytochrome P450
METDDATTLGRAFIQDPHALYDELRAQGPAHPVVMWGGLRAWLVTRYADARTLLADPRLSKDGDFISELFPSSDESLPGHSLRGHMLLKDPPDHTRLRKLATRAFTARTVERLRPRIIQIADELLAHLPDGGVDLIDSFAMPLPLRVISEMLGVPAVYRDQFRSCVEPILTSTNPDVLRTAEIELAELLSALIERKRVEPADDVLAGLIEASDHGERFTEYELQSTAFLLILAGYETTVNLIGNGILALLRRPDQLASLRADSSLLPGAIEEFLRFDSPVNISTVRATTETVRVGAVDIPANQLVMIALLAANHDDEEFDGPDRLDITRAPNRHLAFGHGIHYCLGAPLARLEGQIAIARLLAKFDPMTLDDESGLRYRNSVLMRSLVSLPVHLRRVRTQVRVDLRC